MKNGFLNWQLTGSLAVLGWAFLLARCARETTISLPDEQPKTVAVGYFKPGDYFKVEMGTSKSVFDASGFESITEADATLSIDGRYWTRLRYKYDPSLDRWLWISRDLAEPNLNYTLTVKTLSGTNETVTATSSAPSFYGLLPTKINPAEIQVVKLLDSTTALRVPLTLTLNYLPGEKRYFAFQLSHETQVFRDENGQPVPDYVYQSATNFTTDGRTLSLLNNISGAEELVLINEKYWSDDSHYLRLDAIIPFVPGKELPKKLLVEWRTLSEEFYRYHLSLARQGGNLPLSEPDAVFNNVLGGYGNFSGYSVAFDTLALP